MTRLIALDSSTKKTGLAYFEDGELGSFRLLESTKSDPEERFKEMVFLIYDALGMFQPDIIWIEDTWNAQNIQTTKTLSKLIGVVYAWCFTHGMEFHTILPSEWRKYCGFTQAKLKRAELKQESINYVESKYGVLVNDDVADAICIGDGVINYFSNDELFE